MLMRQDRVIPSIETQITPILLFVDRAEATTPPVVKTRENPAVLAGDSEPLLIQLLLHQGNGDVLYFVENYDTAAGYYQLQVLQQERIDLGLPSVRFGNVFLVPDALYPRSRLLLNRVKQAWQIHLYDRARVKR